MEDQKRYVVTTDFYIFANDDAEAVAKARHHSAEQSTKNDDRCSVVSIHEQPFGKMTSREIKIR